MDRKNELAVRKKLNDVSPSFCLAKWYQVTIHLQNGQTHSCHHPHTHKVNVRELEENPTALHNTVWKKYQRYKMLKGDRPAECDYCWKIEDSHADSISDRTFKSAEDWALPNFDEATTKPWDYDFTPRYVEVSFGHACNFKCIYCAPHISSSIMAEFQRFGHYKESPEFDLDNLSRTGQMPIPKDEWNPYVDAFWKWWPDLVPELKNFRITGGEPLINQNTFRFLDYIKSHPMPELTFGINSNLGIPDAQYDRFLESMKYILENKLISQFEFFTSVDTHGVQAEYIRNGLSYKNYMANVRKFLTTLPIDTKLVFMCTYNALSVPTFNAFLEDVVLLKKEFKNSQGEPRVILDMPYLRDPSYLSLAVLTKEFESAIKGSLTFMKDRSVEKLFQHWVFNDHEISKMERVYNWFISLPKDGENVRKMRKNFYSFIREHDRRRGLNFKSCFPMMKDFYQICEDVYNNDSIEVG
jgi:organic radical activating enzyme